MTTPEIIVYFGFEPSAREWVDKLEKRLEKRENGEWLRIVRHEIAQPQVDPPLKGTEALPKAVLSRQYLDLVDSAHIAVVFLTLAYLEKSRGGEEVLRALSFRGTNQSPPVIVPMMVSSGGQGDALRKRLSEVEGLDPSLAPSLRPLDELGEEAETVLDDVAAYLLDKAEELAGSDGVATSTQSGTEARASESNEEASTLADMILQAADVEGEIAPDGAYLLEAAYALVDKQSKYAGQLTSECLFLAALRWGRRPPGAPSPPHALISLAEAVDAMNPEAIDQMRAEFLVTDEGGGW